MGNIMICYDCLNMVDSHLNQITCFWEIMWIEESNHWNRYVYCWLTRLNTQRTFLFCVAITNVQALTEFMVSMTNVNYIDGLYMCVCVRPCNRKKERDRDREKRYKVDELFFFFTKIYV